MSRYPKGREEERCQASRPRKRCFRGNQFATEEGESSGQSTRKLSNADCETVRIYSLEFIARLYIYFYYHRICLTIFNALTNLYFLARVQTRNLKKLENRGLGFELVLLRRCCGFLQRH